MSLHSNTLFRFRANQSWLLLLNGVCLAEKEVFGLIQPGLEPTIYRTRDKHANYYTADVGFYCFINNTKSLIPKQYCLDTTSIQNIYNKRECLYI